MSGYLIAQLNMTDKESFKLYAETVPETVKKFGGKYKIIQSRKGDRQDEYLIGEDELKYAKEMKIKNRKYFVIDFNNLLKKPLKEIVSSENAKRLAQSEIEKIIKFGLKSNDL